MRNLRNRSDGRDFNQCRPISIEPGFMPYAEGSALVKLGNTHVICTATVSTEVPRWMRGRGTGWVTAEYGMLPRSTSERIDRRRASTSGRSREIERLIGRSFASRNRYVGPRRARHHRRLRRPTRRRRHENRIDNRWLCRLGPSAFNPCNSSESSTTPYSPTASPPSLSELSMAYAFSTYLKKKTHAPKST